MNVWAFIAMGLIAFDAIMFVAIIGKPRVPVTPGTAILHLASAASLIFIIYVAVTW